MTTASAFDDRDVDAASLTFRAAALVREAESLGLVLTVEQVPKQPLAMGHYDTVVHVRKGRAPS